jgi:5-methylcytosine-specific restriction endonuclease McrA
MPIKPENRSRYPADWPAIRAAVLERVGNRCEWCGVPQYAVGYRNTFGHFIALCGNGPCDAAGQGRTWPGLEPIGYAEACEFAEVQNCCTTKSGRGCDDDGHHWFVVRLTIHHQDGVPEHSEPDNLAALCERCHNRADSDMRRRHAAETLAKKREQLCLEDRAAREAAGQRSLF